MQHFELDKDANGGIMQHVLQQLDTDFWSSVKCKVFSALTHKDLQRTDSGAHTMTCGMQTSLAQATAHSCACLHITRTSLHSAVLLSLVSRLQASDAQRAAVKQYSDAAARKSDFERTELQKDKSGVFTGGSCVECPAPKLLSPCVV